MTAPSLFFLQHHEVDDPLIDDIAFQPHWTVRSRLDQLVRKGAISPDEWAAAVQFRNATERVLAACWPARAWLGTSSGGWEHVQDPMSFRHDDLAWLRDRRIALGAKRCHLIEACVVYDLPWADLARLYKIDPKTVRAQTILAIKALITA